MTDSGPKKIRKLTVKVDRNLCISAGTCIAVAPQAFSLDDQGIAVILDSAETETDETLLDAAKACPVAAVIITDEEGKQIYP